MQGFVQGADRQQTTLLPECLDDWVDEGNSIRARGMRLPQAAADADGRHSVRAAVQRAVFGAVSDMFFPQQSAGASGTERDSPRCLSAPWEGFTT